MAKRRQTLLFFGCAVCSVPEEFFCNVCDLKLCAHCVVHHLRNGHDTVKYPDYEETGPCHCSVNEGIAFCKSCNKPVCYQCMTNEHKSHDFAALSDATNFLIKQINQKNDMLWTMKDMYQKIILQIRVRISALKNRYQTLKDDVTLAGKEWHKEVEEAVTKLHHEVDEMEKAHVTCLKNQKIHFKKIVNEIDVSIIENNEILKAEEMELSQLFKSRKGLKLEPNHMLDLSIPIFKPCDFKSLDFVGCFDQTLQKFELPLEDLQLNDDKKCTARPPLDAPSVTSRFATNFLPSIVNDRLYSILSLSKDRMWVGGSSQEIHMFDLHGNLIHTLSIKANGMYMALLDGCIIYSATNNHKIMKIDDEKTIKTFVLTGEWRPKGIVATSSNELIACLNKSPNQAKVVRYDKTGKVKQEIQYNSQYQPLYASLLYISLNKNGDICTTDFEKKAVIAVDRLGFHRFTYTADGIAKSARSRRFQPWGIDTDDSSNILTCDINNHAIHVIDKEGNFLRHILPNQGLRNPRALCIDEEGQLLVGECKTGQVKRIKYVE